MAPLVSSSAAAPSLLWEKVYGDPSLVLDYKSAAVTGDGMIAIASVASKVDRTPLTCRHSPDHPLLERQRIRDGC